MTVEQLIAFVGSLGGASAPVFAVMWLLERKDRKRLERILLGYLPQLTSQGNALHRIGQVIGAVDDEGG